MEGPISFWRIKEQEKRLILHEYDDDDDDDDDEDDDDDDDDICEHIWIFHLYKNQHNNETYIYFNIHYNSFTPHVTELVPDVLYQIT
jgi:hypothetical protein